MVFRKVLALGVEVDTVLADPDVVPGGELAGEVRLTGGPVDHDVQGITLAVLLRSGGKSAEVVRVPVADPFVLPANAAYPVPFRLTLPADLPLTVVGKRQLDVAVHLQTELALAGAVDKSDSDPLTVRAAPIQSRIVDALFALGFRCIGTAVDDRAQVLGFEPWRRRMRYAVNVDLMFVPGPVSTDVIMRAHKATAASDFTLGDVVGDLLTTQIDLFTGPSGASSGVAVVAGLPIRSTVEHAWLDEELDWEEWIEERIAVLVRDGGLLAPGR